MLAAVLQGNFGGHRNCANAARNASPSVPIRKRSRKASTGMAKCCCCVRSRRKMHRSMRSSLTTGGAFSPVFGPAWLTACSVGVLDADRLWSRTCLHCHLLRRGWRRTLGVAWAMAGSDHVSAEFAVVARPGLTSKGLGALLTHMVLRCCRARAVQRLLGRSAHGQRAYAVDGAPVGVCPDAGAAAWHGRNVSDPERIRRCTRFRFQGVPV